MNVILLMPRELKWRTEHRIGQAGAFDIHRFEVERPGMPLRFHKAAPMSLRFGEQPTASYQQLAVEVVTVVPTLWRREVRNTPYERRRLARQGTRGRRGARAIPTAIRWEGQVYATEDTPQEAQRQAAELGLTEGTKVWRFPRPRRTRPVL